MRRLEAATAAASETQARLEGELATATREVERLSASEAAQATALSAHASSLMELHARAEQERLGLAAELETLRAAYREQAERAERERRAAIAAARAERQEKMDRIAALEQQIADSQAEIDSDSEQALIMQQAIAAAEELLAALTAEVAKYELTDESGNTIEPLSKDLIVELEARKDELVERARGL